MVIGTLRFRYAALSVRCAFGYRKEAALVGRNALIGTLRFRLSERRVVGLRRSETCRSSVTRGVWNSHIPL